MSRDLEDLRSLERIKKKQKKSDRHKAWKKRHKIRVQKQKKQLQKRNAQWIKDIQWKVTIAPSTNELLLRQKREKEIKKKQNETDDSADKVNEMKEFLSCLVELRDLRRKKLEARGHFFADDGDQFFNKISELESVPITEDSTETQEPEPAEGKLHEGEMKQHEEDSWNDLELDMEAYGYWCKADRSLDALLTTRRLWDQYIITGSDENSTNNDTLHKVPPMFVIPPPPANGVWASYLS
jgi:hypothetical protein